MAKMNELATLSSAFHALADDLRVELPVDYVFFGGGDGWTADTCFTEWQ